MYQASDDKGKDDKDNDDKKDSGEDKDEAHITNQIKFSSNQINSNQMNQNKFKKIRIILLVINFTIIKKIMITESN